MRVGGAPMGKRPDDLYAQQEPSDPDSWIFFITAPIVAIDLIKESL
jgi:hypothetical protein